MGPWWPGGVARRQDGDSGAPVTLLTETRGRPGGCPHTSRVGGGFYLYFNTCLVSPGLSCSMLTLSCCIWDLVP